MGLPGPWQKNEGAQSAALGLHHVACQPPPYYLGPHPHDDARGRLHERRHGEAFKARHELALAQTRVPAVHHEHAPVSDRGGELGRPHRPDEAVEARLEYEGGGREVRAGGDLRRDRRKRRRAGSIRGSGGSWGDVRVKDCGGGRHRRSCEGAQDGTTSRCVAAVGGAGEHV